METLSFAKSLRNYESNKQGHFKQHKPYHVSNFNNRKTLFNIKIDDDGRVESNNNLIKLNTINEDNHNNNSFADNTPTIQRNVNTAKTASTNQNNLSKSLISLRKSMPSINYQSNDVYTGKISDQRLFDRQYKIENYGQKSILFSSNNTNNNISNSNTNLNNKISTSTLNLVLTKPNACQQMNIRNTKLNEIDLNLHQNQHQQSNIISTNQYDPVSNNNIILINTKPSLSRLSKSANNNNNNTINQQVTTIKPKKLLKENTSASFKQSQHQQQPLIATLNGIKLKKSHTTQYISNINNNNNNNITNSSKLPMLATVDTDNSILNSARQNQSVLTNNLRVSTSASRNRFQNSKYLYFSQSSSFESQSPETHAHNQNSLLKVNNNNNNTQKQASQEVCNDKEIKPTTTKDAFELKIRNNNKINNYNYNKVNDANKKLQNDKGEDADEEDEEEDEYNELNEIEYLNEINRKCTEWLEKYVLPNNHEDKIIQI
jgi:hypothetical protein